MEMKQDKIVGKSLKELSEKELMDVYGGRGMSEPQSTMLCSALITFVGSYLGSAVTKCGKDNK